MLFVHDTSVIRAGQRVAAVKGGNLPGQKRQQPVMNVPVHEHIIRRDAGLPGVQVFAEGEALCRRGRSAVWSMMHGLLPPSSSVTGVSQRAAFSITSLPTATLPVKKI